MNSETYNIFSIIITLIIGVLTIWFARSQAESAKSQVEIAISTNNETKRLLEEIKRTVEKVESVSQKTKDEVERQVDKLIDNQNEHQKTLLGNLTTILGNFDPKQKQNDQIGLALMQGFMDGSMDFGKMEKLVEFAQKFPQKTN